MSKIFVGNLNFKTTKEAVEALFSDVGEVVEVFLPTERETGRPRGFAFVEFSDSDAVSEAIRKLDGHELDGRNIRVSEAQERRRGPGGPPGGGPPRRSHSPPGGDSEPPWGDSSFGGGGGGGGRGGGGGGRGRPSGKGSRRSIRRSKREL